MLSNKMDVEILRRIRRVAIVGNSGTGKSTLARRLHEVTELPLIHLDREFWRKGWVFENSNSNINRIIDRFNEEGEWIGDGNYQSTRDARFARADTGFFFDYPTHFCLWRVFWRTLKNRGLDRPDCAEGCPERFNWEFFVFVLNYRRDNRPGLVETLKKFDHLTVFSFRSPGDFKSQMPQLN